MDWESVKARLKDEATLAGSTAALYHDIRDALERVEEQDEQLRKAHERILYLSEKLMEETGEEPTPEVWQCEGCGETFDGPRLSHGRDAHAPGCHGSCDGSCPVQVECGPIVPRQERGEP
jgi:hypothetical protein